MTDWFSRKPIQRKRRRGSKIASICFFPPSRWKKWSKARDAQKLKFMAKAILQFFLHYFKNEVKHHPSKYRLNYISVAILLLLFIFQCFYFISVVVVVIANLIETLFTVQCQPDYTFYIRYNNWFVKLIIYLLTIFYLFILRLLLSIVSISNIEAYIFCMLCILIVIFFF